MHGGSVRGAVWVVGLPALHPRSVVRAPDRVVAARAQISGPSLRSRSAIPDWR